MKMTNHSLEFPALARDLAARDMVACDVYALHVCYLVTGQGCLLCNIQSPYMHSGDHLNVPWPATATQLHTPLAALGLADSPTRTSDHSTPLHFTVSTPPPTPPHPAHPTTTTTMLLRLTYTYFFIPNLAISTALTINIFLQLFSTSILPLLDATPPTSLSDHTRDSLEVAANVGLVLLFPYPASRTVSNIFSLTLDAFSLDHHPYARRKASALLSRLPLSPSTFLAILLGLGLAAWPTVVTNTAHPLLGGQDTVFSIYILTLLQLAFASLSLAMGWGGQVVVRRAKVIHVLASLASGLWVSRLESPLHTLHCVLIMATGSTLVIIIGYLLLKLGVELTSPRELIFPARSRVTLGAGLLGAGILCLIWLAHGSLYLLGLAGGGIGVVFYTQLTRRRGKKKHIESGDHIVFAVYLYRGLMYGGLVLFGVLFVTSHIQEAQVVDTCFLAPEQSKLQKLLWGNATDAYTDYARSAVRGSGQGACGIHVYGLNLVHLGLLADFATSVGYGSCWNVSRTDMIATAFPHDDWVEVSVSDSSSWVAFLHLRSESRSLDVISIRGTVPHRTIDLIQDVSLYSSVISLQAISFLVPLTAWPSDAIADLVYAGSAIHNLFPAPPHEYFRDVEQYARHVMASGDAQNLVLVGHSLGGALAKIVGSRLGVSAVAYSSPGIVLSRRKWGVSVEDINSYVVNVVAGNDFVPMVDEHGGVVVNVDCGAGVGPRCHEMERTVCELDARCGFGVVGGMGCWR